MKKSNVYKLKIIHWNSGDVERAERALRNVKRSYYLTNKNHRNNSDENVITLCATCHAGVHWLLRKPYLLCSI